MHRSKIYYRNSALVIVLALVVLFSLIPYLIKGVVYALPLYLGAIISFFAIFLPYSLKRPLSLWLKLGNLLGKLNSYLVLGVFFYFLIVPTSIILKLIRIISKNKSPQTFYSVKSPTEQINVNLKDQF
tara:strand:- start:371 stop:754 length:384 start_codon:yes stop_codon:yes gene_type:complete